MIEWVYRAAEKANKINKTIVATDHEAISNAVKDFGGYVCLTDPLLPSGTDRVNAAIQNEQADVIINLQGDEPFIVSELLNQLAELFTNPAIEIATPIRIIDDQDELHNPNIVKVIRDQKDRALYFSRTVIPYLREKNTGANWIQYHTYYKHIGIYAYRKLCLQKLTELPQSKLEKAEQLEQLRFLENGYKIHTLLTEYDSVSVDTEEDLKKVNELALKNRLS